MMKNIYIVFILLTLLPSRIWAQNNLGNSVFKEDFGTIPDVSTWSEENGDLYSKTLETYRRRDNRSTYNFLVYSGRETHTNYSLNSTQPEGYSFTSFTRPWIGDKQPFKSPYVNNPQYVWCKTGSFNIKYSLTDDSYTDGKDFSPCSNGVSVRWINNGGWKLGYWYKEIKIGRGNWLEKDHYAIGANFYQIGEDDWEDAPADHAGDINGLAFMVHAPEAGGEFYTITLDNLQPGHPYHFSLFVKNPDTQSQYGGILGIGAKDKAVPNLTVTEKNSGSSGNSGDLPFGDASWQEVAFDFALPAGTTSANLVFSLAQKNNNTDHRGNGVGIDDITIHPYLFEPGNFTADLCSVYGQVTLTSSAKSLLTGTPLYARWARKDKSTNTWTWIETAGYTFSRTVTNEDFARYDYRIVLSYSEFLLNNMALGNSDASKNSEYQYSHTIEGKQLPKFELQKAVNNCITGTSSDNSYEIELKLTGAITSFYYKVNDDGEETPILAPAEGTFKISSFAAPANSKLFITKSQYQGCEATGITSFELPYKAKANITGLPEKTVIFENEKAILTGTETTSLPNTTFKWFNSEDFTQAPITTGLTLQKTFLESGTYTYYLSEEGEGRCPFVQKTEVKVFPLSKANDLSNKILKLSEAFSVDLTGVENINRYKVQLKSTSSPDFKFTSIENTLESDDKGNARIEFIQGNSILLSSAEMVGQTYTFTITLWEEYTYNNQIYSKPIEKEITFSVITAPGIYLPSPGILCPGTTLILSPIIGGDLNTITDYQWYMDNLLISTAPILNITNLTQAHQGKIITLKIIYTGGESTGNPCRLSIFDPSGNIITTSESIVLLRQKITLTGTLLSDHQISYQWQQRISGKDWENIKGETEADLTVSLTQTTKFRRIAFTGDCSSNSEEILVEAFDNSLNRIDYDENIQIAPNTQVTVKGSNPTYDNRLSYQWQYKQADGSWKNMAGATTCDLNFKPSSTTIVRRLISAGNCKDNISNIRIVSVYNPNKENEIFYKESYSLPNTTIVITGTEPVRNDYTFTWIEKTPDSQNWSPIPNSTSRNLTYDLSESKEFARIINMQDDAGNPIRDTSNIVLITIYDNSENTISGVTSLCKYNETDITGSKPDYADISYQWQSSEDGIVWDYLGVSTQHLRTNISASSWFRRIVNLSGLTNNISNSLHISAIDYTQDNILPQVPVLSPGMSYLIEGQEITGVEYQWQISTDGENWSDLPNAKEATLTIQADEESTKYYRRGLSTEGGCENVSPWSNTVKVVVANQPSINIITPPTAPLCPGSSLTIIGNEREDALYSWQSSTDGKNWQTIALANKSNLILEGGITAPTLFKRQLIFNGTLYQSNIAIVQVYDLNNIYNQLETPAPICEGGSIELASKEEEQPTVPLLPLPEDVTAPEASEYSPITSIHWEKSVTGAIGTWHSFAEGPSLQLDSVMEAYKYRRVLTLINGFNHLSNEIAPQVNIQPELFIHTNIPLDKLNISAPAKINVTPDYLSRYEFNINGKYYSQASPVLESKDWLADVQNSITVKAITDKGCTSEKTITFKGPEIDLPNVITCNGDGINDILLPGHELIVFNRLGSVLYQGTQGWDGKYKGSLVAPGTYFYKVKIRLSDGSIREYQNNVIVFK